MPKPLAGGIAKLVLKGMKQAKMTMAATLTKVTTGTRTPGSVTAGTNPTEASFSALGFLPNVRKSKIGETLVEQGDRIVALFGKSIAGGQVPDTEDKVTIDGVTTRVVDAEVDAAKAVYTLLTRE